MTVSHLTKKTTDLQFELIPNAYKQHLLGFWGYATGLFLPTLAIHIFLLLTFSLSVPIHLGVLGTISLALLLRIQFYQKQNVITNKQFLVIGPKHLAIKRGKQLVTRIKRQDLVIEAIGWGPCEAELLPAVRIKAGTKLTITLGATSSDSKWTDIRKSVQATDYLLTEKDWEICTRMLRSD